jgi:hypothetical protein
MTIWKQAMHISLILYIGLDAKPLLEIPFAMPFPADLRRDADVESVGLPQIYSARQTGEDHGS